MFQLENLHNGITSKEGSGRLYIGASMLMNGGS